MDHYDWIAPWYDWFVEPALWGIRQAGFEMYRPGAGVRVLDAACGTGAQLDIYAWAGSRTYGLDLSASCRQALLALVGPYVL